MSNLKDFFEFTFVYWLMIIVISLFCFGAIALVDIGVSINRKEAIEAGVAHWTINPVTGQKTFEFKECK